MPQVPRATFVYIVMLVIFAAGLWAIISFGSVLLRAPEDLAGEWQLFELTAAPDDEAESTMIVEQSGRFMKIAFSGGTVLDLTLVQEERYIESAARRTTVKFSDGTSTATFIGVRRGDVFALQVSGLVQGDWVARRISRPYGPDHTPKRVTTPRPTTVPAEPPTTAPDDPAEPPTTAPTTSHARL